MPASRILEGRLPEQHLPSGHLSSEETRTQRIQRDIKGESPWLVSGRQIRSRKSRRGHQNNSRMDSQTDAVTSQRSSDGVHSGAGDWRAPPFKSDASVCEATTEADKDAIAWLQKRCALLDSLLGECLRHHLLRRCRGFADLVGRS
jgi:hypothetical protein